MKTKNTIPVAVGDTIYFVEQHGAEGFPRTAIVVGETSRSWLTSQSTQEWWMKCELRPNMPGMESRESLIATYANKVAKSGTTFFTEDQARNLWWANRNRNDIGRMVSYGISPELLIQVATLIGYTDKSTTEKK